MDNSTNKNTSVQKAVVAWAAVALFMGTPALANQTCSIKWSEDRRATLHFDPLGETVVYQFEDHRFDPVPLQRKGKAVFFRFGYDENQTAKITIRRQGKGLFATWTKRGLSAKRRLNCPETINIKGIN